MPEFFLAILFASVVAAGSYLAKFLTASGAIATFFLSTLIFGLGDWQWTVPIFTFFLTSSFLSFIGKERKKSFEQVFEKVSRRDAGQVLANGGMAGVFVTVWSLHPLQVFYFTYLGSIAAVTADTWSTEIGILSKTQPRFILGFKPVSTGTSGAISLVGTLGGFLGTVLISLVGFPFVLKNILTSVKLPHFFLITILSGLVGSFVDSLLGATAQAQYRCLNCGAVTERKTHCKNSRTELIRGKRWITNDIVNYLNSLTGGVVSFFLYQIL